MTRSRAVPVLLAALGLGSCTSSMDDVRTSLAALEAAVGVGEGQEKPQQEAVTWNPDAQEKKWDWIKLKTGEWLKGEITVLRDDRFEFDSDKLDDLTFDWEDVHEVHSPKANTLLFDGHRVFVGPVTVIDDEVIVETADGERRFPRSQLETWIPGKASRASYWSGKVSVGGAWRVGNVNQTTINGIFGAKRRTITSRTEINYNGSYSELEGDENANNHRLDGKYDYFVNRRFYVTVFSMELFSDPFQNIALRATPAAGVGYTVVKTGKLDWEIGGGAGYQWTKSQTVEAGADREATTAAIIANTALSWDMTEKIELSLNYNNQIGVPDTKNTNRYLFTQLDIDLKGPLDLNLAFTWWRTGNPQADSNGVTPEKDDLRFTVGLEIDF